MRANDLMNAAQIFHITASITHNASHALASKTHFRDDCTALHILQGIAQASCLVLSGVKQPAHTPGFSTGPRTHSRSVATIDLWAKDPVLTIEMTVQDNDTE